MSTTDQQSSRCSKRYRWRLPIAAAAMLWAAMVVGGIGWMWSYESASTTQGPTPRTWPADSRANISSTSDNLLLFLHPRCPCSRATLGELARLMAGANGRLTCQVFFVVPQGENAQAAANGALWDAA